MGCDATYEDQLAETPHCVTGVETQSARPKPEHTGVGFSHAAAWKPDAASPDQLPLHPRSGAFRFPPQPAPQGGWTDDDDYEGAGIGGGTYSRLLQQDAAARIYRVRKLCAAGEFATVTQALAQWSADKQSIAGRRAAIIEIADSATYHEAPAFRLEPGEYLQLRAASQARPVLRVFDYHNGEPEQVVISGGAESRFTLDGVLLAGGGIQIVGAGGYPVADGAAARFQVALRHCTLVPGWDPDYAGNSPWRLPGSITLRCQRLSLRIDHCILGPLHVPADSEPAPTSAPMPELHLGDSIVDGGHPAALAICDGAHGAARLSASFRHATIIGAAQLHQIELAEDSVFMGALLVAHRTDGALRYCYVTPGSRTPRRLQCQPELAQYCPGVNAEREAARVRPRYASLRYGAPGYCQLAPDCADEVLGGAQDDTALGACAGSCALTALVAGRPVFHADRARMP